MRLEGKDRFVFNVINRRNAENDIIDNITIYDVAREANVSRNSNYSIVTEIQMRTNSFEKGPQKFMMVRALSP